MPLATIRNHPLATAAIVLIIGAAISAALLWWLRTRDYETTDDAFIDGRSVALSAEVAGAIVEVPVTECSIAARKPTGSTRRLSSASRSPRPSRLSPSRHGSSHAANRSSTSA